MNERLGTQEISTEDVFATTIYVFQPFVIEMKSCVRTRHGETAQ